MEEEWSINDIVLAPINYRHGNCEIALVLSVHAGKETNVSVEAEDTGEDKCMSNCYQKRP